MHGRIRFLAVAILFSPAILNAQTSTWRPAVMSDHGMVASGHALASEAGLRILKSGGNAVDAAIATWWVQGLAEPMMTGIGSDMFVMIYIAKTGEVKFINGSGFAPMAATMDYYKTNGGIPMDGPLSISVPGSVGAAELAVQKYGSKPLAEILAPAIELADQGFPVTEHLANSLIRCTALPVKQRNNRRRDVAAQRLLVVTSRKDQAIISRRIRCVIKGDLITGRRGVGASPFSLICRDLPPS